MSWSDSLSTLAREVATLYKEIATTSVRFDMHAERTRETLARYSEELRALSERVARIEEEHVRDRAALTVLEGRLTALSEQALHAVAREAARELMREALGSGPAANRVS